MGMELGQTARERADVCADVHGMNWVVDERPQKWPHQIGIDLIPAREWAAISNVRYR
jgi:hypothetical protein